MTEYYQYHSCKIKILNPLWSFSNYRPRRYFSLCRNNCHRHFGNVYTAVSTEQISAQIINSKNANVSKAYIFTNSKSSCKIQGANLEDSEQVRCTPPLITRH